MTENKIEVGNYVVVQRQNYKKLHKFNKPNSSIALGRDNIELSGIENNPYFSVFKMIPKGNKKSRCYTLELSDEITELKDEIDVKVSGTDNRNIFDDGQSQKLTHAEIEDLKGDSTTAANIVETLISNSNTFSSKTEYSQDKYLRKKEKKYFEYLQIVKPNLRVISEIMYKLDPAKIQGIRTDTLSQIITMLNIHSEGNHMLYDSGSNGLLAAALLSSIGANTNGKLIHMHPGNMSQKQALLAMNFSQEQNDRCISVNVYSALRQYYQGCDTHETVNNDNKSDGQELSLKRKAEESTDEPKSKVAKTNDVESNGGDHKTQLDDREVKTEPKKPKWHFDNIAAAKLIGDKVDSLVIACKEDPQNIFNELVNFVKPGRPFVVYYPVAEPLQALYLALKPDSKIAALKLFCNWMRNYQVLPDRTHPEVNMNGSSGFLLTGYVLK